ncbi:MAG: hypothetical protein I8H71_01345 [Xanthomonadaceae bacterium]|nr:hypothetical protein [Xanthomonadaceae bacterium]MBH2008322.1 hypothetical protein [Xanthomonadaceae bacterium]
MPMELLKELAERPLPATFTTVAEIDKLRVLRAAGLVAVMLPAPDASDGFARVLTITPKGRVALGDTESA